VSYLTLFILALLGFSSLRGEVYYEGTATFRNYGKVDLNWMVQFLPYNPIIIEAGAYCGDQTIYAAKVWPQSQLIVAFEPNPLAFAELQRKVDKEKLSQVKTYNLALHHYNGTADLHLCRGPNGNDRSWEHASSLLPPLNECQGPNIEVPCVILDDWCKENQIDHIDILRLELEGLELQVLQSSPQILKNTKIIVLPSFFRPYREGTPNYFELKAFLTESHFVPLAHWYEQGERGLAVYVSQELYDAYFIKCLGLGLGGLLYP
jgi:FkbM family methyltransferase